MNPVAVVLYSSRVYTEGAIAVPVYGARPGVDVLGHLYVRAEAFYDRGKGPEDESSALEQANPREGETVLNSVMLRE